MYQSNNTEQNNKFEPRLIELVRALYLERVNIDHQNEVKRHEAELESFFDLMDEGEEPERRMPKSLAKIPMTSEEFEYLGIPHTITKQHIMRYVDVKTEDGDYVTKQMIFEKNVPTIDMSAFPEAPFMSSWTAIQRNVPCDDETTLRYMPYIEGGNEEKAAFLQELDEAYEMNLGWDVEMTDQKLIYLVEVLTQEGYFIERHREQMMREEEEKRREEVEVEAKAKAKENAKAMLKAEVVAREVAEGKARERAREREKEKMRAIQMAKMRILEMQKSLRNVPLPEKCDPIDEKPKDEPMDIEDINNNPQLRPASPLPTLAFDPNKPCCSKSLPQEDESYDSMGELEATKDQPFEELRTLNYQSDVEDSSLNKHDDNDDQTELENKKDSFERPAIRLEDGDEANVGVGQNPIELKNNEMMDLEKVEPEKVDPEKEDPESDLTKAFAQVELNDKIIDEKILLPKIVPFDDDLIFKKPLLPPPKKPQNKPAVKDRAAYRPRDPDYRAGDEIEDVDIEEEFDKEPLFRYYDEEDYREDADPDYNPGDKIEKIKVQYGPGCHGYHRKFYYVDDEEEGPTLQYFSDEEVYGEYEEYEYADEDDDPDLWLLNNPFPDYSWYETVTLEEKDTIGNAMVKLGEAVTTKEEVFELLSVALNNFEVPEELRDRYNHLIKTFVAKDNDVKLYEEYSTMPNIDEAEEHDTVYSAEDAMHSYQTLFCRRCFMYDCQYHNYYTAKYRPKAEDMAIHGLCGRDCFLNIEGIDPKDYVKQVQQTPIRGRYQQPTIDETDPSIYVEKDVEYDKIVFESIRPNCQWQFNELTMINTLMHTFKGHYCRISQTLCTKKCYEVFAIAKELKNYFTDTGLYSSTQEQRAILSKKKQNKKKQKFWSSIHGKKVHAQTKSGDKSQLNRHFKPCDHGETPCDDDCECGIYCEKFCNCSEDCPRRFPGCMCKGACNTKQCPCFYGVRECDPDLCTSCNSASLDVSKIKCKNVAIQRGFRKHILMGHSQIAGWGAFLNGTAEKHDLISEYCGEMISQGEADRRGKIYDKQKCSFLFNLNNEFVIDAKWKGNKVRFANHSTNPNCYAKVLFVNGDHRIGIFADRHIEPHEELFFDYRYKPNQRLAFVGVEANPIPNVLRNHLTYNGNEKTEKKLAKANEKNEKKLAKST